MPSIINTNISSLNAQRNLAASQNSLSTSMQRLSSGLRVNSAKDDAAGLAIELDGSQHYGAAGQLHDAQRTKYLEGFGIRVLRFSNLDVMQHFEGVCRVIDNAVKSLP